MKKTNKQTEIVLFWYKKNAFILKHELKLKKNSNIKTVLSSGKRLRSVSCDTVTK